MDLRSNRFPLPYTDRKIQCNSTFCSSDQSHHNQSYCRLYEKCTVQKLQKWVAEFRNEFLNCIHSWALPHLQVHPQAGSGIDSMVEICHPPCH